ncbi:YjjG family noncanonical pyrimidine nucleotidase [Gemella sp. 27098_8_92]|uniref:YjjG family noncanonical pyrimidine nucleotidase n=1 Tax=Gemella sp. 27098_8_92 TaxID=3003687 RepID=UPI00352C2954
MTLNRYKYLLFDLDDTLLNFQQAQELAFKKLLEDENIEYSYKLFEQYEKINKSLWRRFEKGELANAEVTRQRFIQFFEQFGKNVDGREIDIRYRSYLAEGNQLFEGVVDMLEKLHKTHKLYVASNGIGITQHTRLKNNDLNKYFEKIFISEEIGSKKPDREFFEKIFDEVGVENKDEVLMIGDTLTSDILGANNIGIDSCLVDIHKVESNDIIPTYTINKTIEILEL